MAKEQQDQQSQIPELNLEVRVERYIPSLEDLLAYAQARQADGEKENFNAYLKKKYFPEHPEVTVFADLSNMVIGKGLSSASAPLLNLKGVDLSGCILKGTQFLGCDLT